MFFRDSLLDHRIFLVFAAILPSLVCFLIFMHALHTSNKIRAGLQAVGLPESNFAGHSFRIGAATAAANAGIEDSVICTLGRWSSSAFLTYIRTPREQLARFSRTLATS